MRLGPILGFRGATAEQWRVSVLLIGDAGVITAPVVTVDMGTVGMAAGLGEVDGSRAWRVDLILPRGRTCTYAVEGRSFAIAVPAVGAPPRVAYASCNGFSSKKLAESTQDPFGRWRDLITQHARQPFGLLLMGGDQVYADQVFDLPALDGWSERKRADKLRLQWTATRQAATARFYQRLYLTRWAQPEMAAAFATIPTLMMWDDHDIFDGWGSYDDELQRCPVYQGIYGEARAAFRLFQMHCAPSERVPGALSSDDFSALMQVGRQVDWVRMIPHAY